MFKSPHSDQNPSEINDFRGIFLFFVYCGAGGEYDNKNDFKTNCWYSLDQKFLDYLYDNISYSRLIERDEYRDFVSRYHGIKVVRDGFVIQGFGDGDGGDWLGLSSSSKTTGYFFDLRNDSVIGCVYLTGVANSVLKETTNREGFVEDEYFRAFKSILDGSIKRINRNRKKLNDFMKQYVVDSIAFSGNPSSDVLNYKPAIEQIREDLRTVDRPIIIELDLGKYLKPSRLYKVIEQN